MNQHTLIEQYFCNNLSKEDKKKLDWLLENDKAFAEEFQFHKNLKAAITKEEQESFKEKLKEFERQEVPNASRRKWLVAASIVFLLGFSAMWYFTNKNVNSQKLYASYYQPYPNIVHPIVRGNPTNNLKTKAFMAYEAKQYEKALHYFNELLLNSNDETFRFYKANILLALNKTQDAIIILENNLQTSDSLDAKNKWYLALAQLKLGHLEKAEITLKKMNKSKTSFKEKRVNELLKKLE